MLGYGDFQDDMVVIDLTGTNIPPGIYTLMIIPGFSLQLVNLLRLAVLMLAAIFSMKAFAQDPTHSEEPERIQRSYAVDAGSTLVVENLRGTIHVKGSDTQQVKVSVFKNFKGTDKDKNWWLSATKVEFKNDPNHVSVTVDYPDHNCDDLCTHGHGRYTAAVELTIEVPRRTNLHLTGHKPDIAASDIMGDIRINSHKSKIDIQSTTGAIQIMAVKDTVTLRDVAIQGTLDVRSDKGTVMIIAQKLGEEVHLETGKGEIILRMPANTGADVDFAGGSNSSFHSAFNIGGASADRTIHEVRGKINQGGTRMRLRTSKGSIGLEKLT